MMYLLVMRHAKSSWSNDGLADHDRPLKDRGKRDAPRMGKMLREEDLMPDLIVTSSAKRAVATAELVADACGYQGEILVTRALYHADSTDYLEVLNEIGRQSSSLMVVGHNPGMEDLVQDLTGEWVRMPTAAIALLSFQQDDWGEINSSMSATLEEIWTPRAL